MTTISEKRQIKAIVTDLDRTLLRTDKTVSAYTLEVLKKCRDSGVLIMVASARPLRDVLPFRETLGFSAASATNGAIVALPERTLETGIRTESCERIISGLLKFADVVLSAETSGGLFANVDIPLWQPVIYDKFPKLPEGITAYKILASSKSPELYENVHSLLTDDVYCTVANNDLVQIMSKEATKWRATELMLSHFGLSPDEAVYFGDDNDDIEPIERCGVGVAVANAIPRVIKVADFITESNDADGVARFIEENYI